MEQIALLKSLLNKDFYDEYKGDKCPHRIFSKQFGVIKTVIDAAMKKYNRDLTVGEIEGLFLAHHQRGITTAEKEEFKSIFFKLRKEDPIGKDVADEILSKLFQIDISEELYALSFAYANDDNQSLEPLRKLVQRHRDDFLPDLNIEWDDLEVETLIEKNDLETRWHFNLPSLAQHVEGVNAGHLIVGGARPNTGKTSFHASLVAGTNGFAQQGA